MKLKKTKRDVFLITLLTAIFGAVCARYDSNVSMLNGLWLAATLTFAVKLTCLTPPNASAWCIARLAFIDVAIVSALFLVCSAFFIMAHGNSPLGVSLVRQADVKCNLFSIALSIYWMIVSGYLLSRPVISSKRVSECLS